MCQILFDMSAAVPYRDVRSMSLVERKKLQWAKEREELARLGGYWRSNPQSFEKSYERSRYGSKPNSIINEETLEPSNQQRYVKDRQYQERRGSLPPLYKNQYNFYNSYDKSVGYDKGGETSGYGSDSNNNNIPAVESHRELKKREAIHNTPYETNHWVGHQTQTTQHQSGYESSSSLRDDRPKWGDKGVGVGKFWQPKEEHFNKSPSNEPPSWVKRGLQDGLQEGTIVVANSSPSVSPEQRYEDTDRPYTGSSYSTKHTKTHIRGQNIPIDEAELAERERKRQIAIAHQEAIRQQLEERERKKKEERDQKLREEIEEELRIQKEREYERQRQLEEEKLKQEKLENERKRKEAIKMAMEVAEKEAKLEKIKQKMLKQSCDNIERNNLEENIVDKEKVTESVVVTKNDLNNDKNEEKKHLLNNNIVLSNSKTVTPIPKNDANTIQNEIRKHPESSRREVSPTRSSLNKNSPRYEVSHQNRSSTPSLTPRSDNFAVVLHPSLDNLHQLGNFGQYAVLVPATSAPQIPIAIPIGFVAPPNTDRSLVSTARTENRILTPTRYRNSVPKCDSSTQTDASLMLTSARSSSETTSTDCHENIRGKATNLEIEYNTRQKERRSRSESTEERPKWGVNRPPTRYLKQSEKDPLYQRRKLRQKQRESNKSYDEKNSSDDTEPSVSYRKKGFVEKRHSRAKWRTHHNQDQMITRNVKMYQREIIPLESNNDQIYYKSCCCSCRCQKHKCSDAITRVDVLQIEENSPRETVQYQEVVQSHNVGENKVDLINKLTSLHSGLMLEKERWENSPRTPPDLIPVNDQ